MNILPTSVLIIQALTAILMIFYFKKYQSLFFYSVSAIVVLSACVELLGFYFIQLKISSHYIYFFYTLVVFNLIALAYSYLLQVNKLLIYIPVILFNAVFVYGYFKGVSYFNSIIVGAINTSFYIFLYLRQLLISDEIIIYKKLLPFWISIGFLAFYLPSIPFFVLRNFMIDRGLFFILNILTILMNLLIMYGLIWSNKEKSIS
ncbi:hypothetical protein [Tenacibaculum geojense]|uniref:Uncharacterized protein n=1 Tax=Tenacibaculum geojense TaxID=915352 RepID=A0ABW3JPR9_9FLAO